MAGCSKEKANMSTPGIWNLLGPWTQIRRRRGVSAWPAPWHGQSILTFHLLRDSGAPKPGWHSHPPAPRPSPGLHSTRHCVQPPVHICVLLFHGCLWPLGIIPIAPEENGIWHAHPWFLAGHSRGSVNICEIKTAEQGTVEVLDIPCLYYFSPSIFI